MKRIKVSWKWASKKIDCTIRGITNENGCGGRCCSFKGFWPPMSGSNPDVGCDHRGDNGCTLEPNQKPNVCLLYPFTINSNDKLVIYGRALMSSCKVCYHKNDPDVDSIWENLKDNMIELFGEDQYNRVLIDIQNQNDSWLDLSDEYIRQAEIEKDWEVRNIVPPTITLRFKKNEITLI